MRLERRKKYIWGCVLCALLTAVLIGMIYYYNDVRVTDQVSEGTLIWQAATGKRKDGYRCLREMKYFISKGKRIPR